MTRTKLVQNLALILGAAVAHAPALAHEGHDMPGVSHWHSTDVLGFVAVALVIAGAIWMKGRK
ncbi:hypothetical protein [Aquabacterium sp.]|uniref:hypothetical protein n=1 Tax=Aquabacterium sp. TaxID=1872578 RepID=UPI0025C71807|nr:hypothetical protein [Aquabacterium sp.]